MFCPSCPAPNLGVWPFWGVDDLKADIYVARMPSGAGCSVTWGSYRNATTLEVTRKRRKVERCDVLARIKHMKMQGLLVEVTPRAKLEIAQGRYTGLGMFTAATGNFKFSRFSKCKVQMQPDVAFET